MKMLVGVLGFLLMAGVVLGADEAAPAAPAPAGGAAAPAEGGAAAAPAADPATGALPAFDAPEPAKLEKFEKKDEAGRVLITYTYYADAASGRKIKHGTYTELYENGKKKRECTYKHNRLVGADQWWFTNGNIWMERNYKVITDEKGQAYSVLDGQYREFLRNGQLSRQVRYADGKMVPGTVSGLTPAK